MAGEGGLIQPFLAALQASLSVLLTISYGVVATQFKLINDKTAKDISKLCVRLLLPALLISNIGSQLSSDTIGRYVPIFIWAIVHNCVSIAIGVAATKGFRLPSWVTPAIAFNNTTALPLLLIEALDSTGILKSLLADPSDSTSEAVQRAKSYFLVNSVVGSCITFAIGPQLLNAHEEDAPDKEKEEDDDDENPSSSDEENGHDHDSENDNDDNERPSRAQEEDSLLPASAVRTANALSRKAHSRGHRLWSTFPCWLQKTLTFTYQFINAPVIGAAIGLFLGLVPALHRAFFNDVGHGGVFNAWLTASVKNVGELFAALQVLVVGVKLSSALKAMEAGKGEAEAGRIPWGAAIFVEVVRFVVWPAVSIPLVWALATRTDVLSGDPMLWFCMMLMPTGPPALKLSALADCNGSSDREKMSIAKFLTLSYVISPLIAFAVVGSLKATQAAME